MDILSDAVPRRHEDRAAGAVEKAARSFGIYNMIQIWASMIASDL